MKTRVYSDGWGDYQSSQLQELGFEHRRIIHRN